VNTSRSQDRNVIVRFYFFFWTTTDISNFAMARGYSLRCGEKARRRRKGERSGGPISDVSHELDRILQLPKKYEDIAWT
jgi:hypothetical protein